MSVLNVIDTQTITASGNGYIVVKSGVLRVYSASASSIQIDDGPAITLAAGVPELISCGKPKSSRIKAATDAAAMVVTVDHGGTPAHTFAVGDYIQTVDGGDTDGFVAAFESAVGDGKKVTAITDTTITTDYDSSAASADYAVSSADVIAGTLPQIQRGIKLTAGSANVVVEQVQIVGG